MARSALARAALPVEPGHPEATAFAADVIAGLTAMPKRLPPKYFYDIAGSELFERITDAAGVLSDALRARHPDVITRRTLPRSFRKARR